MRRMLVLLLLAPLALGLRPAVAAEKPSLASSLATIPQGSDTWYAVHRAVTTALLDADRAAVARDLAKRPPSLSLLLARLDIDVRAGRRGHARDCLLALCQRGDFVDGNAGTSVADFLIEKDEWDLALLLVRARPAVAPRRCTELIEHVGKAQGPKAADALLEELAASGNETWLHEWVRYRSVHGDVAILFKSLEEAVRREPASLAVAQAYVGAVRAAESRTRPSLDWMTEVCLPSSAVDAYELGGALNGVGASAAAAVFLERSLATALTDEDRQRIQGMSQVFVTRPDEHFRGWTKQELVEVYQALQRPDLAQPLVEDLVKADLAGGGPAFYVARLAGTVQAASGERGVETLILAEEAAKPDSPEYWLARGEYFGGRREDVAAREAFDKALALAPPEAADGPRQKSGTLREQVLRSYVSYLRRSDQTPPAVALVRTELRIAAPDTGTRNWALWSLHAIDVELPKAHVIRADDELLWRVLANSPRWDAPEEHCLAGMLLQATGRERHAANARAQALCRGTDPSRALALGSFFAHWKADQMAVPLLRDAIHRLSGPERREERERAQSTLFGAYLHLKRAREAEQQFAGVAARLTADEIPVRLADLAVLAAQTGDAVGAMRLWRRVVNLDGTALGDLPALVSAGLSPKLTSFYREWQKRDSESWVPAAALKILAQRHQPAHPKASSPR